MLCRDVDGVKVEMQKDIPHTGVIKTGCQGLCELGPLMRIEPYGYQYVHVQPQDCKEIVERTVLEGKASRASVLQRAGHCLSPPGGHSFPKPSDKGGTGKLWKDRCRIY